MPELRQIVFLGPPASGKGTQARRLSEYFSIPYCSTGELLRAERAKATQLGEEISNYLHRGVYVPDHLVDRAIEAWPLDLERGFVLDGYPRTLAQGWSLDERLRVSNQSAACAIVLEVGYSVLLERVLARANCSRCGRVWSKLLVTGDLCPACNAPLEQRDDDSADLFKRRHDEYATKTLPLVNHYDKQGQLHRIPGEGMIDQVFERILEKLTP